MRIAQILGALGVACCLLSIGSVAAEAKTSPYARMSSIRHHAMMRRHHMMMHRHHGMMSRQHMMMHRAPGAM